MRPPIDGGVVLLTGASAGIGLEMARMLAPRVATLILVARRKDRLDALSEELTGRHPGLKVVVMPCDLGDMEAIKVALGAIKEQVGAVDILINNAGFGDIGLFEMTAYDKLDLMLRVNCQALTLLTHRLLPDMIERGRGGVLNISSGFGFSWLPGVAVYAGTKHYVTAFTESLRLEVKGHGVVVTQVCPGPVATEFESVAGNPTGQSVPKILEIGAEQCARESLAGFERGRALVIPGWVAAAMMNFTRLAPRWMVRLCTGWTAAVLRKRQAALANA